MNKLMLILMLITKLCSQKIPDNLLLKYLLANKKTFDFIISSVFIFSDTKLFFE